MKLENVSRLNYVEHLLERAKLYMSLVYLKEMSHEYNDDEWIRKLEDLEQLEKLKDLEHELSGIRKSIRGIRYRMGVKIE